MQPVPELEHILGSIRWVLVGGIALRAYMPERMTHYVTIVIHKRDAVVARKAFIKAGYVVTGELSIGGFSVQLPDAPTPIDVLTRADS